jgi:hypothetical protein
MGTTLRSIVITALALVAVLVGMPGTASAAAPTKVGYDVSYPQCGTSLPGARAFAIVGVNGGLSTKANPCLASQLRWAATSNGSTSQPTTQLYLNTANPGEVRDQVTTWPTSAPAPTTATACGSATRATASSGRRRRTRTGSCRGPRLCSGLGSAPGSTPIR